ncbi:MAG TPA: GAF domain-containing protein [Aggregatilineales bacterium]|nr:GAF domain-containing protein [Aggregatilineales bacterium]
MQSLLGTFARIFLTPQHRYADRFDQMRARLTMLVCLFIVTSSAGLSIGLVATPITAYTNLAVAATLLVFFIGLVCYIMTSSGRVRAAGLILLTLMLVGLGALSPVTFALLVLPLPVLYAAIMFQWPGLLLVLVLEAVSLAINTYSAVVSGTADQTFYFSAAVNLVVMVVSGLIVGSVMQALHTENRLILRLTAQLRATSEIAQTTVTAANQGDLLTRIVNYLRDRFGFYQVQIFLIESEHRYATLVATTSDEGRALQQRGYRVAIGGQTVVGQVALLGEAVNASQGDPSAAPLSDTDHDIRSEVGLPLTVGDQLLGVLDVYSKLPRAFSSEDVENLRTIATQVSLGIRNAQIFDEQKDALNENRRLFLEAELNLREMQRLNQRLTGEAWDQYLKAQPVGAIGYTVTNNQIHTDTAWTPTLAQAASTHRPVIISSEGRNIVAVPVELRGKPIGAIEVETDSTTRQTETLEMLQSVAQRLALSIDNARLFEQTQELAQQELEVNTISARLQGINTMDEIIKVTVDELSRALGAEQASIRLATLSLPLRAGQNGGKG